MGGLYGSRPTTAPMTTSGWSISMWWLARSWAPSRLAALVDPRPRRGRHAKAFDATVAELRQRIAAVAGAA